MKKYLYILCGLMCLQSALAFDATVFPTLAGLSRTVKYEFSSDGCAGTSPQTQTIQPNKEVTINGKQYLEFTGNIYLREADNKVYVYSGQGTEDLVLYDYALGVGEMLKGIKMQETPDGRIFSHSEETALTVIKIEPITLLDGKEYKKWTFNNGMEYVETIGMYGEDAWAGDFFLLIQQPIPVCQIGNLLVCVSRNGQLLYEMPQEKQEQLHTYCMSVPSNETNFPEGKVWSYRITPLCTEGEVEAYIQQTKISGAKTINGKQYVLINDNTPIREDGKQVFAYDDDNDKDVLIYDFSLEVGDKITSYDMGGFPKESTVTAVDYITLLDGRKAKRIQYDYRATDIEYVGSTSNVGILAPLYGYVLDPCGPIDFLCCSYNGQPLYETSAGSCDNIDSRLDNTSAAPQTVKYLRNGQLFLQLGEQSYDVLGRPVSLLNE